MKWSWKLARVAGISVQVHWTFLIVIAWVVLIHISHGAGVQGALGGVVLVLAVFACVVLHELGHALTARSFGIATRDITLLPIGGVARLERMPEEPKQEFLVALAGPAVNVVIAALLAAVLFMLGSLRPIEEVTTVGGNILAQLLWVNVVLVLFNLLPAFPMDGGRVLRAVLASRLNYARATRIAAGVGQLMAILFGFAGLLGPNPFLVFIAIFVYLGAQAEAQHVELKVALEGLRVRDAMMTRFQTLEVGDALERAVGELLAGSQQDFPVLSGDDVVGILTRRDLVRALKEQGREVAVGDVMRRDCPAVTAEERLEGVLPRMRQARCGTLPVVRDGRLVGLLTLENIGELILVRGGPAAVRVRRSAAGALGVG